MSGRLQMDRARAESASERLREIAFAPRLQILSFLLSGEYAVSEIEAQLQLKQPALSQHLSALRKADLVASRRVAKAVFYRLNGAASETFVAVLDGLLGADDPALVLTATLNPATSTSSPRRRVAGASVFAETGHRHVLPALRRAAWSKS